MAESWYPCRRDDCPRKRRQEDILCRHDYLRLPKKLRRLLWERDLRVLAGNITLVLQWLDDNPEES